MDKQQYKVILTGELLPGHTEQAATHAMADIFQTPAEALRLVFEGGQHPINERFSADEALELQTRLERVGVRCKIERLPARTIDVRMRRESQVTPTTEPHTAEQAAGMMHCPACGQEQLVSKSCVACGVVYADFNHQRAGTSVPPPAETVPKEPIAPSPLSSKNTHAQDNWHEAWADFDDIDEPGENFHLSLFFGEKADIFLMACERYMKGPSTRFALGWNWAAVFSPFIWIMYRKMWGWGLLVFVTEIFLPALLITIGSYDPLSSELTYLGVMLLVLNRLFWPAVVNFLYCRYARSSVQHLHMMAPNYAAEIDIATAGGVSNVSVLVGLALAGVMSVLLVSLVASVEDNERFVQEQRSYKDSGDAELTDFEGRNASPDDVTGVGEVGSTEPKNKWIATRTKLRFLGQKVNGWIAEHAAVTDATQLNLFKLRQELSLKPVELKDGWGGDVQFIPDTEGYRLISAGPDKLFGTADDIQYRRVMTE